MHKEEAGRLFAVLGEPIRVKIMKMLYHNTSLSMEELKGRMGLGEAELTPHLSSLCEVEFLYRQQNTYTCNKALVDTLMSFIPTKCACC